MHDPVPDSSAAAGLQLCRKDTGDPSFRRSSQTTRKTHQGAILACIRKLLTIMHAVVKNNAPSDPKRACPRTRLLVRGCLVYCRPVAHGSVARSVKRPGEPRYRHARMRPHSADQCKAPTPKRLAPYV